MPRRDVRIRSACGEFSRHVKGCLGSAGTDAKALVGCLQHRCLGASSARPRPPGAARRPCRAVPSALFVLLAVAAIMFSGAFSRDARAGGWRLKHAIGLSRQPVTEPRFYPMHVLGYDPYAQGSYGVPTYNWGYFGARHGQTGGGSWHDGYYGDYLQWRWPTRY